MLLWATIAPNIQLPKPHGAWRLGHGRIALEQLPRPLRPGRAATIRAVRPQGGQSAELLCLRQKARARAPEAELHASVVLGILARSFFNQAASGKRGSTCAKASGRPWASACTPRPHGHMCSSEYLWMLPKIGVPFCQKAFLPKPKPYTPNPCKNPKNHSRKNQRKLLQTPLHQSLQGAAPPGAAASPYGRCEHFFWWGGGGRRGLPLHPKPKSPNPKPSTPLSPQPYRVSIPA